MKAHRGWLRVAGLCLLLLPAAFAAHAQTGDFPGKPVTIISDAGAGAAPDVVTRLVAEGLGRLWGQQVVVLNRPGGNGSIAAHAAAEAVPDGYTLYAPVLSTFVASPSVAPNLPVKVPRDFSAIGFIASQPMFVSVDPALGIATLPQLIARAKQEPDKISFAVTGVGRLSHLTGELLQMRAGIKLQSIPYTRGPAAALSDVASGRVSLIIENYGGVAGAIGSGQVKPIAVAASERLPEFPDLATVAETIPGFAAAGWVVVVAPKGTPAPVIAKVSADLAKVVTDAEFKKRLAVIGSYSRAMAPDEVQTFVAREQETWLPVLERISK
jgi:tripartite-type tricarboxylate transporter receptor subunit TctC